MLIDKDKDKRGVARLARPQTAQRSVRSANPANATHMLAPSDNGSRSRYKCLSFPRKSSAASKSYGTVLYSSEMNDDMTPNFTPTKDRACVTSQ